MGEVLILGVMALIVIGPKQLPELARTVGRIMSEMRRATDHFTEQLRAQATIDVDAELNKKNPPIEPDPAMQESAENPEYYTPIDEGSHEPLPDPVAYDPDARRARDYGLEPEPEQLSFAGSEESKKDEEDDGGRKG